MRSRTFTNQTDANIDDDLDQDLDHDLDDLADPVFAVLRCCDRIFICSGDYHRLLVRSPAADRSRYSVIAVEGLNVE